MLLPAGPSAFQSTLPVWGATCDGFEAASDFKISIHAPRVGSDCDGFEAASDFKISIHAPRVGSDLTRFEMENEPRNFNPRSPCGERRIRIQIA